MILHISPDNFFIDIAYREFEKACPKRNHFKFVTKSNFLLNVKFAQGEIISPEILLSKEFLNRLVAYKAVVIHFLTPLNAKFVCQIPNRIKVLWIGWGGDYYPLVNENESDNLLDNTLRIYRRSLNFIEKSKIWAKKFLKLVFREKKNVRKAIARIDFFSPVLYEEYEMCKEAIPELRAEYISWNYGNIDDFRFGDLSLSGNDLLLGNSATYTNNHVEALNLIKDWSFPNRILVPLNYGDRNYAKEVARYGKEKFGQKFVPIESFLPFRVYAETLSKCSFVVMNHIRQQGLGNILMMMHMGAAVFLRAENPIYRFFKKQGALIFSVDEMHQFDFAESVFFNPAGAKLNQDILLESWGVDKINDKTNKLVQCLIG